ncbi:pilus assembly protein [Streptomyces sp. A7024]|uniref:Pilus assembly protein n=2 Tax=Streptomyces coryli TaxID=1128680 RepID=A0A6G4TUI4_9ACTN|nr:TadE/TadG family type IV pilus assembly protein [Streptomyces coryli]NGN63210.1 pilus assembly protein [Streptomyces coryli]
MRADRGSYSVEVAVLTPVMLALVGLIIAFGRISMAGSSVDSAAHAAARAASLARDAGTAQSEANAAARASLTGDGVHCAGLTIDLDTSGFAAPLGTPGNVTADITCTAPLSDIGLPGLPGSKDMKASFTSPLDAFRSRGDG